MPAAWLNCFGQVGTAGYSLTAQDMTRNVDLECFKGVLC